MECKQFEVQGYFESATFNGNFDTIKKSFEGSTFWTADILEKAGAKRRLIEIIQRYNRRHPCQVFMLKGQSALIVAPIGKKQCLAYRLEPSPEGKTKITPVPFLMPRDKIGIVVILTVSFILPALLTPFVWRNYEQKNLRMSRYYLISFCHYLESRFAV